MVRIKPAFDGTGAKPEGSFYDGPPPPPSTYRGTVKRMALAKIGSGDNKGADRIALVVEISEGKYKGAGILHSLNLTQQGKGWVNQFLDSLTDGSDVQKNALQKMFWQKGYDVEEKPGKLGQEFIVIGKNFKPIGKNTAFVTKMGADNEGNPRAEIARFVTPVAEEPEIEEDDVLDSSENGSSGSGLDEFKQPEPESVMEQAVSEAQDLPSDSPAEESPVDDDEDDGPWS